MMAHQQLLSIPADFLVCLMTFTRLRIILKVGEKMTDTPRSIIHQVVAIYLISFILDGSNWMLFDIKVKDLINSCILSIFLFSEM